MINTHNTIGIETETETTSDAAVATASLPGYEEWVDDCEARWVAEMEFLDELAEVEARGR